MTLPEMRAVVAAIHYPGWTIGVHRKTVGTDPYLQVRFVADGDVQYGRKWRLSNYMTRSEIVMTALMAIIAAHEHEVREHFTYRGRKIFQPHVDVEALHEVCGRSDARQHVEDQA